MKEKINAEWHRAHRMPKSPTLQQRLDWHLEHQKHCNCRETPEKLKMLIEKQKESTNFKT